MLSIVLICLNVLYFKYLQMRSIYAFKWLVTWIHPRLNMPLQLPPSTEASAIRTRLRSRPFQIGLDKVLQYGN